MSHFNLMNVINSLNPRAHEIDTEVLAANIRANEQPASERTLLRRELDAIEDRLAVKPKILEARRKLKDAWKPRVEQLEKLLQPQQEKLSAHLKTEHIHPRNGNCFYCTNKSILEDNISNLEEQLKFARHWVDSLTREDARLTAILESVTKKDLKRRDELKEMIEALAPPAHVLEERIKIPPMEPFNFKEPKGTSSADVFRTMLEQPAR
jgi:hypothetical protein